MYNCSIIGIQSCKCTKFAKN